MTAVILLRVVILDALVIRPKGNTEILLIVQEQI